MFAFVQVYITAVNFTLIVKLVAAPIENPTTFDSDATVAM